MEEEEEEERTLEDALVVWPSSFEQIVAITSYPSPPSTSDSRWILNKRLEVKTDSETHLRGLYAMRDIKKGEKLLAVKLSDFWTVDRVLSSEFPLIDSVVTMDRLLQFRSSAKDSMFNQLYLNDKVILALGLLHVKYHPSFNHTMNDKEEKESYIQRWKTWIETLPSSYPTLPLCFDSIALEESREKLLPMSLWSTIYQTHRMLKSIFMFLRTQQLLPHLLLHPQHQQQDITKLSESEFRWAYSSVQTRSWKHPTLGIIMIPFADLINHHNEAAGVHFTSTSPSYSPSPSSPATSTSFPSPSSSSSASSSCDLELPIPPLEPIPSSFPSPSPSSSASSPIGMWLLASQDYSAGSQVFGNYGPRPDDGTLTSYGYVDEGENRFNSIVLWEDSSSSSSSSSSSFSSVPSSPVRHTTQPCVLWNGNLNAIAYQCAMKRFTSSSSSSSSTPTASSSSSSSPSIPSVTAVGQVLKLIQSELLRLLREHPPFSDFSLHSSSRRRSITESEGEEEEEEEEEVIVDDIHSIVEERTREVKDTLEREREELLPCLTLCKKRCLLLLKGLQTIETQLKQRPTTNTNDGRTEGTKCE